MQLVHFSIGEEEFGVDILKVQENHPDDVITKVPRAPDFVEGVINLAARSFPLSIA
jgi:purine-binding chemotaxis protein CheW